MPDKSPTQSAEEKPSPFGGFNLKSIGKSKDKTEKTENVSNDSETVVRPSSIKQGEQTKSERPGSASEKQAPAETSEKSASEKPSRPAGKRCCKHLKNYDTRKKCSNYPKI